MPLRSLPQPDWVLDRRRQLGRRIRDLRRERALSQDDVAERSGLGRRSIQRYEAAIRDPAYGDLVLIAAAIGVPVRDLVDGD